MVGGFIQGRVRGGVSGEVRDAMLIVEQFGLGSVVPSISIVVRAPKLWLSESCKRCPCPCSRSHGDFSHRL